jgi:hypothetical protein
MMFPLSLDVGSVARRTLEATRNAELSMHGDTSRGAKLFGRTSATPASLRSIVLSLRSSAGNRIVQRVVFHRKPRFSRRGQLAAVRLQQAQWPEFVLIHMLIDASCSFKSKSMSPAFSASISRQATTFIVALW